MADSGLPPVELTDWQCYCGYVNTGLDATCVRCGLSPAEAQAQARQAALAEQQQAAAVEQARVAQQQARQQARPSAAAGRERVQFQFDGNGLELLGISILVTLLCVITLGIYSFWGHVQITGWLVRRTIIYGRRLDFTGSGLEFLGVCLLNVLLCLVTLSIYTPWAMVELTRWHLSKIVFAEPLPQA